LQTPSGQTRHEQSRDRFYFVFHAFLFQFHHLGFS